MGKSSGGVRSGNTPSKASPSQKISDIITDIRRDGFSKETPFSIGYIEQRMLSYANANNIDLSSRVIYMSQKSIAHAMRDSKAKKGLTINESDLVAFPERRRAMDLFYDGKSFTDYKAKYIVSPSYEIKISRKRTRKVAFVTAGKTDGTEFKLERYVKI